MNNLGQVIGVRKLTPIIDFNCIVDTEYGLLQLIYDQYYDLSVFNKVKFEMPSNKILLELYTRKCKNPLIPFINEGISEKDADDYYNQFIDTKYEDILDRSCGTNIQIAISNFNSSGGDVLASILCHNELQKQYISNLMEFKQNKIYMDNEFKSDDSKFNQLYLKYVDDLSLYIKECVGKNVYFSSMYINMREEDPIYLREDKNLKIISSFAYINTYDLYNMDYLKGEYNG